MLTTALLVTTSLCAAPVELSTDHLRLLLGPDATLQGFVDTATGHDYAAAPEGNAVFWAMAGGATVPATALKRAGRMLRVEFGHAGSMTLAVRQGANTLTLTLQGVTGESIESVSLCDLPTSLPESLDAPFVACALARNNRTNVAAVPGPTARLAAVAYADLGFAGASVALIGCPPERMRAILQEAILGAPEVPTSALGGPFALDDPRTRSSYIFNFGGLTEETADEWIEKARSLGFDQIHIHGGPSIGSAFRFGDCALDPAVYPEGRASLRRAIDRIHEAGILVGMQPYAFFVSKESPWVTPVPDPGLAAKAAFTLAADVAPGDVEVPVAESTAGVSTITGFFERNSVTLRVEEELIVFTGVSAEPPYRFTGCQRGAYGTTASAHPAGEKAYHLQECFGLFLPDPHSPLFQEVAQATADFVNECGFDAIYFDALDGEDTLGGAERSWHYGSGYVYEVLNRLNRPVIVEMSTFYHHLWPVRSRLGAWDHPNRCHKQFIDAHVAANLPHERMFLLSNLGWWAFVCSGAPEVEATYPDDIEYLCAKALAEDSGLSLTSYEVGMPLHRRLADVMRRWQGFRREHGLSPEAFAALAEPGAEFTLRGEGAEATVHPVAATTARVTDGSAEIALANPYEAQAPFIRIEALHGCAPWDDPNGVTLIDPADMGALTASEAAPGVTMTASTASDLTPTGDSTFALEMASEREEAFGSWARLTRAFDPPLDLGDRQALGLWVYGDGQGELLNLQLRSPDHITRSMAERYVTVDFEGWRYFELIEPDADRWAGMGWPYGHPYYIYREYPSFGAIRSIDMWCNGLPPGGRCRVLVSAVRALPLRPVRVEGVEIASDGQRLALDATLETNSFLEMTPGGVVTTYDRWGNVLGEYAALSGWVAPSGESTLSVALKGEGSPRARVRVSVMGPALE